MKVKTGARKARSLSKAGYGVLCGTDFSENAGLAAQAAAAIAGRTKEPLILAHAVELPDPGASRTLVSKWLTTRRRKDLRREAKTLSETGVEVETRTLSGRPDEVLVDLARTEAPRLLVVSSTGHRGMDRWLVGSVSERTAERTTIPTLVVRDARSLIEWADGKRPLKVFVCFNLTVTSGAALRWVKELAALGPCEVVVGYVDWPPEQQARLGGAGPLPLVGNPSGMQAVLERDMKAKAGELLGEIPFRVRVEACWGRPDVRLAGMAKEEGADLVVVGSHQYRGFERLWHTSVSRGLLHQAEMSVAIVPLATNGARGAGLAPPVRRVLVPTDFSECADAAIPHAYSILRGGGTVHLLHVVTHSGRFSALRLKAGSSAKAAARHARECAEKLHALIPAEAAELGILTQVEVVKSRDAADAICRSAERLGADVICLSTHGRSGMSKTLMGSVAQTVMTRSCRPLLVVHPPPR